MLDKDKVQVNDNNISKVLFISNADAAGKATHANKINEVSAQADDTGTHSHPAWRPSMINEQAGPAVLPPPEGNVGGRNMTVMERRDCMQPQGE